MNYQQSYQGIQNKKEENDMDFVLITGPQAVGKTTVAYELEKLTGLKVFHNHITIEPVLKVFEYKSEEGQRLIKLFREEMFNSMVNSKEKGMVFTYIIDFNLQEEWDYVNGLFDLFEKNGAKTYFVELETDLDTRLERNTTEFRLSEKQSKRNTESSKKELLASLDKYRMNSNAGEVKHENYLRIDNTNLSAEKVAKMIFDEFNLREI